MSSNSHENFVTAIIASANAFRHGVETAEKPRKTAAETMRLVKFAQGELLKQATRDPDLRRGICAALCDFWLSRFRSKLEESPEDRLGFLRSPRVFALAMQHQAQFAKEWYEFENSRGSRLTGHDARALAGARVGMSFDTELTTVSARAFDTPLQMIEKLMRDIAGPFDAAAWDLRFSDGKGHAIAGFCSVEKRGPFAQMMVHIFDPNAGEIIGEKREGREMLGAIAQTYTNSGKVIHSIERIGAAH